MEAGIAEGRRNDLTGGGLKHSNKGWRPTEDSSHGKGDERIPGSSAFVLEVMKASQETWERGHALRVGVSISLPSTNMWPGSLSSTRRKYFFRESIATVLRPEAFSAISWCGNFA